MEENLDLEYRMYGFVPYNLSPIQQGIQFGHAVVEYGQNVKGTTMDERIYDKWANNDKTFIILNGGTTNNNPEKPGSLNELRQTLFDANILFSSFFEPDLGDQLTAFVFLVDERVYDYKKYPDWDDFYEANEFNFKTDTLAYDAWISSLGGDRNVFLREFLKGKRLA
jgi:hypothetical protein